MVGAFMGCEKDPNLTLGNFELNIRPRISGQALDDGLFYENIEGRKYKVDAFKLFVSDITIVKEDGEEVVLSEVELLDMIAEGSGKTQHGEGVARTFPVSIGQYKGMKVGIGVKPELNHMVPGTYESTHPLSEENGMNWSWSAGYRFMVLEGMIDASANMDGAAIDHPFIYHTGTDTLYRELVYLNPEHAFEIKSNEELQFILEMDMNRFFYTETDTIDMVTDNFSHTTPVGSASYELSEKIVENMVTGAIFKPPF